MSGTKFVSNWMKDHLELKTDFHRNILWVTILKWLLANPEWSKQSQVTCGSIFTCGS